MSTSISFVIQVAPKSDELLPGDACFRVVSNRLLNLSSLDSQIRLSLPLNGARVPWGVLLFRLREDVRDLH